MFVFFSDDERPSANNDLINVRINVVVSIRHDFKSLVESECETTFGDLRRTSI